MDLIRGITKEVAKQLTQNVIQQKPVKTFIHKKTGNMTEAFDLDASDITLTQLL